MNINEQWRPVDGFEELYAVSNLGRVKSLNYKRTGAEKILKPVKRKDGYLQVNLCRNEKCKTFLIHRLVAAAFIPNPMGFTEINHLNEDKTNNYVDNLEFCDRRYNLNFGHHNEKVSASLTNHPALSKTVEASRFSDFSEIELRFLSTNEAGRNGYNQSSVSACCRECYHYEGNNKYKGLYWRYAC